MEQKANAIRNRQFRCLLYFLSFITILLNLSAETLKNQTVCGYYVLYWVVGLVLFLATLEMADKKED